MNYKVLTITCIIGLWIIGIFEIWYNENYVLAMIITLQMGLVLGVIKQGNIKLE